MNDWDELKRVFLEILDKPPGYKEKAVQEIYNSNPELGKEIAKLLRWHERADNFEKFQIFSKDILKAITATEGKEILGYSVVRRVDFLPWGERYQVARDGEYYLMTICNVDYTDSIGMEKERYYSPISPVFPQKAKIIFDGRISVVERFIDGIPVTSFIRARKLGSNYFANLWRAIVFPLGQLHKMGYFLGGFSDTELVISKDGTLHFLSSRLAPLLYVGVRDFPPVKSGSPFMAPETRMGSYSSLADIYSLGMVFWYWSTGEIFPNGKWTLGNNSKEMLERMVEKDPAKRLESLENIVIF